MEMYNRPPAMPEFIERTGTFPGLGIYKEKLWVGLIEGEVPVQLRQACEEHVVARVVEIRHIIHFRRNNIPVPFNRLSVQYLIDRSNSSRYSGLNSKYKCIEIAKDGILPIEHYCGSGLRGEGNWIPNHLISISRRPRYSVLAGEELDMYGNLDNHTKVMTALKDGPIYADFLIENNYGQIPGGPLPHRNGKFTREKNQYSKLHAVCLVGYGLYTPLVGKPMHYFLYLNTYSVHWGDKGYGRIEWNCLSSVWIPIVPDVLPPPQSLSPSPSPPPDDHDPSSHHGGPSRTTQSSSGSQEELKKHDDLKRKRAIDSGGGGGS